MTDFSLTKEDFTIESLGSCPVDSPLQKTNPVFISDDRRITYYAATEDINRCMKKTGDILSFEAAGPRRSLYFTPAEINCGIVTCGGLCPGINDVIRSIVYEAYEEYGVRSVYGFRYGYQGLVPASGIEPLRLDTELVNDIHEKGGSILHSSRGLQNVGTMVDCLQELGISILFAIGGDGTLRGAAAIATEIARRDAQIAVVGIPKTIDNDIECVEKTFGFETAVELSRHVIQSAHVESKGAPNGVGLVKLMGRDSGFIAAQATLANADVNFCLVPEVPFSLSGDTGLLNVLEQRLRRRGHAVVVVAEGAGQNLMHEHRKNERRRDASGNVLHDDIGIFLRDRFLRHFQEKHFPVTVKYIDPSYIIRSKPANANDSLFCLQMGQHAVHAGMAGKTSLCIGYWNNHYTHVPIRTATRRRKTIDPESALWQTVLSVLG